MKKLFISIAAMAAICAAANAQEAFKHLSIGVGIGTTGAELELAMPVLTDHLVLKAGANLPNASASFNADMDISSFSSTINGYVSNANNYIAQLPGETAKLLSLPESTPVSVQGTVRLTAFRAMLEYYPFKTSGFHVTAGVYVGNSQALALDATATELWDVYSADKQVAEYYAGKYPQYAQQIGQIPDLVASIDGKTYQIKSPGNVNLGISIAKARPYLGLGFGRSVPDNRVGFQFDLGAAYLGKLAISSTNEVNYVDTAPKITFGDSTEQITKFISKPVFYPVITFKLTIKLF